MINESDAIPDPLPAGGNSPPSPPPVGPRSEHGSTAFAIFLCCIGVALAVIVVGRLGVGIAADDASGAKILPPLDVLPMLWFITFVLGVVALFLGVNDPEQPPAVYRSRGIPRRIAAWVMYALNLLDLALVRIAGGLVLLGASMLVLMVIVDVTKAPTPENERFALVYEPARNPVSAESGQQSQFASDRRDAEESRAAEPGEAEPQAKPMQAERAVLLWSVPGERANPRDGILAMLLGSVLIIVFGIFYPRMSLNPANETTSFIQKLVVPLLSLGLFGVGAQQQAHAEQLNKDAQLARQGLPPVMYLSASERFRVLHSDYLQAPTVTYLRQRLEAQRAIVNVERTRPDPELSKVREILDRIRAELAKPNPEKVGGDSALLEELARGNSDNARSIAGALRETTTAVRKFETDAAARTALQKERDCAALHLALDQRRTAAADFYKISARADEERRRNILDNVWLSLKGEDAAKMAAGTRQANAGAENNFREAIVNLNGLCGK